MARRLCLVTGASAGIGAASARVWAANGYDIALTARRADRLEQLAEEIRLRFGVETVTLPADLAEPGGADAILRGLVDNGRTVDALVNNAGYAVPGRYGDADWGRHGALLQVLVTAVAELSHKLLPGMVERGYGRILNVASVAGLIPGNAGAVLYGPAKAFVVKFSQGLRQETLGSGVHVTALCPGYTWSEFHDVTGTREQMKRLPTWLWLGADEVAAAGYEAVEANRPTCVTGAPNKAIAALSKILPDEWLLAAAHRYAARIRPM
jgi:short-subunit dehydrogenase